MAFVFSARSLGNLAGVHPDLQAVAHRALELTVVDFVVIEGRRTRERQRQMVAEGKSRTMNSRHLTGHAIDIAVLVDTDGDGKKEIPWNGFTHKVDDNDPWDKVAKAFKDAARELGIPIIWGGDWTSFGDAPHFELERHAYPADGDIREPRPLRKTSTGKTGAAGIAATASGVVAVAAENAEAVLTQATNPALRAVVEALPWAAGALSVVAVVAVVLLMVRKTKAEKEG